MLSSIGFKMIATAGTQRFLAEHGVPAEKINKVLEGRPHIVDAITNGEVQLVFNTTEGPRRWPTAVHCGALPSCIKCHITPLFQGRWQPHRASRPIWAGISRSARCKVIFPISELSGRLHGHRGIKRN